MSTVSERIEDRANAALLRSGQTAELESRLRDGFQQIPKDEPIRVAAESVSLSDVRTAGWDALNTAIAVHSRETPITAVGLDLTIHGEAEDDGGRTILPLETSYYADTRSFAFSQTSRDQVRRACEEGTPPWTGDFVDIEEALTIDGLNRLHDAVVQAAYRDRAVDEAPHRRRAAYLGGWMRHLRAHQVLARDLALHGLARPIPMIVGTHDLSPYVIAAYWPTRTVDYEVAAERAIAERAARHRAHDTALTEQAIAEWRERRTAIRTWPWYVNPRQRNTHRAFAMAHENLQRKDHPALARLPYSFQGSEADFAYLCALYRHLRHPETARPHAPTRTLLDALLRRR